MQFGPDKLDDLITAMANLKQTGTVPECYNFLMRTSKHVSVIGVEQQLLESSWSLYFYLFELSKFFFIFGFNV